MNPAHLRRPAGYASQPSRTQVPQQVHLYQSRTGHLWNSTHQPSRIQHRDALHRHIPTSSSTYETPQPKRRKHLPCQIPSTHHPLFPSLFHRKHQPTFPSGVLYIEEFIAETDHASFQPGQSVSQEKHSSTRAFLHIFVHREQPKQSPRTSSPSTWRKRGVQSGLFGELATTSCDRSSTSACLCEFR
ncbi:hypothetical protein BC829DRAFT_166229 [Chytridium lagenaria]|nr:hypothetical protein BC829DRAFT_166229 [Chytridium lagenaria]